MPWRVTPSSRARHTETAVMKNTTNCHRNVYQVKVGLGGVDLGPLQGQLGGRHGEVGDGAGLRQGLPPPDLGGGEEREEVAASVGQAVVEDQAEQGGRPLAWSKQAH